MPVTAPVPPFHPDLVRQGRFLPRSLPLWRWSARVMTALGRMMPTKASTSTVAIADISFAGLPGAPNVSARTYRPVDAPDDAPVVLWMHGGGLVIGSPGNDDQRCLAIADRLGVVVVNVDYRLAIDAPFPAAIDDCEAALRWITSSTSAPRAVAVAGESAGGGLAAALAQRAFDIGIPLALQVLIYPMLDDRTTLRTDIDPRGLRIWSPGNNRFGCGAYLGAKVAGDDVPSDAAPARRHDLSGLAPAWIGVGTADLFHDEDVAYAQRLEAAGVSCTLEVVKGAFHGFEQVAWETPFCEPFTAGWMDALGRAVARR